MNSMAASEREREREKNKTFWKKVLSKRDSK
jgi:hypothetical protein